MNQRTETWTCAHCGELNERRRARGTKPKWCSDRCRAASRDAARAAANTGVCSLCGGKLAHGVKFCGPACAARYGNTLRVPTGRAPSPPTVDPEVRRRSLLSPLRAAFEDRDTSAMLALLQSETGSSHPEDCWFWKGPLRDGYPRRRIADIPLHRAIAHTFHEFPGSESVHHACANRACVNPSHLQPVTHAQNAAEMLARKAYESRIRDLEDALAALDPNHALLNALHITT